MVRTVSNGLILSRKLFDEIGVSFIFINQLEINPNWIKVHAKQIL